MHDCYAEALVNAIRSMEEMAIEHRNESPTLRDWFAGMATQGWIHALAQRWREDGYSDDASTLEAVRLGYVAADAMLAARTKRGEGER